MNRAKYVVQLRDPLMITLINKIIEGSSVAQRQANNLELQPFKLVPDMDVVILVDDNLREGACVHARRMETDPEAEEFSVLETVSCRNEASKDSPNGYLCSYHQRFLAPKVEVPIVKRTFPKGDIDAYSMLSALRREVLRARQSLTDSELHDHMTFEHLKNVQIDEAVQRKYLERN